MNRWTTVQSAVYTRGMARWQPKERPINQISRKNRGLATLLATAHALNRLDARLRKALPDSMRSHIGLACLEDNTLVLAATSPAWASRARLIASDLLYEANQTLDKPLRRTRVIVVESLPDP